MPTVSYLERVTECEHGEVDEHDYSWMDGPNHNREWCPGGSRVRKKLRYEMAAIRMYEADAAYDTPWVYQDPGVCQWYRRMALIAVSAALGDTE